MLSCDRCENGHERTCVWIHELNAIVATGLLFTHAATHECSSQCFFCARARGGNNETDQFRAAIEARAKTGANTNADADAPRNRLHVKSVGSSCLIRRSSTNKK